MADTLKSFLSENKWGKYEVALNEYGVEELDDLLDLDEDDLKETADAVKMKPLHKKKFIAKVQKLKEKSNETVAIIDEKDEKHEKDDRLGFLDVPQLKEINVEIPNRTIMVIGETGTGKSSFLNSCVNYLFNTKYENAFRYKLINIASNSTESDTKDVTIYYLNPPKLSYQLTVVDTPGFGDTQGIKRDKEITGQIKDLFTTKIQEIDAILFVIKSTTIRLTATQKYVFGEMLKIFSKTIKDNIFIVCTHHNSKNEPKALEAIKAANIEYKDSNVFSFNNIAFDLLDEDDEVRMMNKIFWKRGISSFNSLFKSLDVVEKKSLMLSVEILKKRQVIQNIIEFKMGPLKYEACNALQKVQQIRKQVIAHSQDIEQCKDFVVEVSVIKTRKKETDDVWYNCNECKQSCGSSTMSKSEHYAATYTGLGWLAKNTGRRLVNCRVCHCKMSKHDFTLWKYEQYTEPQKVDSKELRQQYIDKTQKQNELEQLLCNLEKEGKEKEQALFEHISVVCKLKNELNVIALRPYTFIESNYIDQMIISEENEEKKQILQKLKQNEKLLKEITEKSFNLTDYIKSDFDDEKKDDLLEKYNIRSGHGLALVICIKDYNTMTNMSNLYNTVKDKESLIKLFENEYKYNVIYNKKDIVTYDEFDKHINKARSELYNNPQKYDAFIFAFSGHGTQQSICFSDDTSYGRIDLYKFFNGLGCKPFSDKPKLLVFDACKGSKKAPQIKTKSPSTTNVCEYPTHPDDNIIVFNANSDFYVSYDTNNGGLLIQSLHNVLKNNTNKICLDDMSKLIEFEMKRVCKNINNNEIDNIMQLLEKVERGITKKIYFCKDISDSITTVTSKGSKYDNNYPFEKWDICITKGGCKNTYTDGRITPDYKQKLLVITYNNNNDEIVLQNKTFDIEKDVENVWIKCDNGNLIEIQCKDTKPAKYWYSKLKQLSK